ncbi:PPK2 family polyphosphate kinase [Corynebacterium sp.]|uniref:PPK2 family polyphosphate kinase n=1 Tax=Corynebacterium sp. TaxID=1720 RepID=UPI002A91190C|nr:PPK2 family polyphosphate kinase [Corynebacterium sp.]MDY5786152.1 PPK2 family polyphosphate kinase [Corynebacterium sp.]
MATLSMEEVHALRVEPGFRIAEVDPGATPGLPSAGRREAIEAAYTSYNDKLELLQECLYANGRSGYVDAGSVLLVLQGMDTSGKGGIVKALGSVMDIQGLRVAAFGPPTDAEAAHDFLWRFEQHLPSPGEIAIFDRSYYEDVLVQRVKKMAPPEEIERRYGAIVAFEDQLAASGTRIIKVMAHISREFQAKNLRERIENETKHWKYSPGDIDDRALWPEYMEAYEIALTRTSTDVAPWYCIPSDNKKYCRSVVKTLMYEALMSLDLAWPAADFDQEEELRRLAQS